MQVLVRYFAAAREASGLESERIDLAAGGTVAALFEVLAARHPALEAGAAALRFAVDETFVEDDAPLSDGAVVALIPPVGGG